MIRRATFLIAAVAVFVCLASPATAAPIADFSACSEANPSGSTFGTYGAWLSGMTLEDHCIEGGGLQIKDDSSNPEEFGGWALWTPSGLPPLSYSFDLEDGDTSGGLIYAAASCSLCAPDIVLTSLSPGGPAVPVSVPFPMGAEGVFIYAMCMRAVRCDASDTPAKITNISVQVTDDTPPEVAGVLNNIQFTPGQFTGWTNKKAVQISGSGDDSGSGTRSVSVTRGDNPSPIISWDFAAACTFSLPLTRLGPCDQYSGDGGFIDTEGWGDGIHDVKFTAKDAWENESLPVLARLGIDRTPPPTPLWSSLDFAPSGWPGQRWTSEPEVTMSWAQAPEVTDPDFESPHELNDFILQRRGSATSSHGDPHLDQGDRTVSLPADGEWDLSVRYIDRAGNAGNPSPQTIGLDKDAPFVPEDLEDVDWLSASAVDGGGRISWSPPETNDELESKVCGYVVKNDDSPTSNPIFGVDDATFGTSWPLPAGLPQGDSYFHVRAVSCAGLMSPTATAQILVDTESPQLSVTGLVSTGSWSVEPQTATIIASDEKSGVQKVGYQLDHGSITWQADDHANVAIPPGRHDLTVHAVDIAGNASTKEIEVRTDTDAPVVELESAAIDDPARAAATVRDLDSGLLSATIEMRRVDANADSWDREWRSLGGAEPLTRGSTAALQLARAIDDARLAQGSYELRVNAVDLAGNATTDGDFAIRSVQLPLRRVPQVSAALAEIKTVCRTKSGKACASTRKCSKKLRCRNVQIIDRDHARSSVVRTWSKKSVLIGDAIDSNGAPIVGATVDVTSTPTGHDSDPVDTTTTDAKGHYELQLPPGPSRVVRASIGGTPTQQPAHASASLNVRTEIDFAPQPRTLRSGKTLLLRGRVLHADWLPVGGVTVSFQWYSPYGWRAFHESVQTDATGRFSLPYPWRKTSRNSTVLLRAQVEKPAGWPFAPGSSDAVKISVLAAR